MKKLNGIKSLSNLESKKIDTKVLGGRGMSGSTGFYEIQSNFVDAHGCHDVDVYDGNGGAGRACLRLSDALNENGVQSEVLVYYKFGQNSKIASFTNGIFAKAMAVFNIMAERYLAKIFVKAVKTPFSLQWFGKSIINNPKLKEADIIHLHWVNHGFLSPKFLAELDELEKPVVWIRVLGASRISPGCLAWFHITFYRSFEFVISSYGHFAGFARRQIIMVAELFSNRPPCWRLCLSGSTSRFA